MINHLLQTDAIEIDLYEWLKYDRIRNLGQLRAFIPAPYNSIIYLQLASTRQRYGRRIWFLCACNRRTTKLYVFMGHLGCRHCLDLKYASQYSRDIVNRREMNERKMKRLEKQRRRLWYNLKPTQFGRQFYKLRDEEMKIAEAIRADLQASNAKFGILYF